MEVSLQSFRKRFTYDPQKDLLGKGGFGEVYKAYDNEDHHFVALKISQGTADDKYNLVNEVKRFKKLHHPNIVQHIEAYEVNTGSTDIHGKPILYHVGILEYADGGTLADLLKKGTPDYRVIEDLAKDIIEGLACLHSNNIIHRDLKPSNILLFSEGEKLRAKITDFGIAKRTDATAASTQLVGTVEYMAPEYFTTGIITPASDVWSIGVMLLEALTGSHPFGKTTQGLSNEQIINNILTKDLNTATQNLHSPFKEIIIRCLLRETNLRPQSSNDLKGLLQQRGDAFAEKTHVIGTKPKISVADKPKGKWERWWKGLFDFDVSGGKWSKLFAKELIVFFILSVFSLLLPLLLVAIAYSISEVEKNKIEPQMVVVQKQLDSLQAIVYRPFNFSDSYFGWHTNDSSLLFTDLGAVYQNICHFYPEDKLAFDRKLSNIALLDGSGRSDSYFSFAEYALNKVKSDDQIWIVSLQSVIREYDGWENFDLVNAIKSVNNLSIDMPVGGGENPSLFPNYIFEPRYFREEIKKTDCQTWLDYLVL